MQLLWRGIAEYVQHYEIGLMFGCASLPGTDPKALALPLSYLAYNHLAPEHLRPRAVPERYEEMRLMPLEAVDARAALAALPPLIKGYLRLGGFVGEGAVVDHQFQTTDVCVVVKTDLAEGRVGQHSAVRAGHHSNHFRGRGRAAHGEVKTANGPITGVLECVRDGLSARHAAGGLVQQINAAQWG